MLAETTRGRTDRARFLAGILAEAGYRVEVQPSTGLLRLVLADADRRTA